MLACITNAFCIKITRKRGRKMQKTRHRPVKPYHLLPYHHTCDSTESRRNRRCPAPHARASPRHSLIVQTCSEGDSTGSIHNTQCGAEYRNTASFGPWPCRSQEYGALCDSLIPHSEPPSGNPRKKVVMILDSSLILRKIADRNSVSVK